MKYLITVLLSIVMFSCNKEDRIIEIDTAVNKLIVDVFNKFDHNLWNEVENEFYNRMKEMKIYKEETDSLSAFKDLMNTVLAMGYPDEYYVEFENPKIKKMINNLNKIGVYNSDESSHSFLYTLTNSIIKKTKIDEKLQSYPRDLLVAFATTNPDSLRLSFDLSTTDLNEQYTRDDLKRPGLYKELLLFYFIRMIDEDFKNKYNY